MRVLAVIQGPVYGGAHNQIVSLRSPLAKLGVELEAVLSEDGAAAAERMRRAGTPTSVLPLGRLRASPDPRVQARFIARTGPDLRRLRRLIAGSGTDVVQVHGATNPQGAIAARLTGAGVVWQLFDTRAPMALRRVSMPLVVRLADSMTTWGRGLAESHPGATSLGDRLFTVFPPVDASRFAPDPDLRISVRRELGIKTGERLVGTVGVRNPQKGHDQFVRAAAKISARDPRTRFCIFGAPSPAHESHMRSVEAEARSLALTDRDLRFIDPGSEVSRLLQALDVFVMTSVPRSEGMPTAILEAMACGKPVVATDVGATRELVDDGVTGLLVPALQPDAVATAVSRVLADAGLSRSMGAAGLEQARIKFSLGSLAEIHARAYATADSRARGRRT